MKVFYKFDSSSLEPLVNDDQSRITVKALVFYQGEHTDGSGRTLEYSADQVRRIADNSNSKIADGIRVQLFKDHEYDSDSVIGNVLKFEAREITASDLPHEGMTDLIGQWGIFAEVEISGEENVTRYKDNRIKSVSSGIDLKEEFIYEVSVVPFPALTGASLFQKYGLTIEKTRQEKALRSEESAQSWKIEEGIMETVSDFTLTLASIDLAKEDEFEGQDRDDLKLQAIEDLAANLREKFGVNPRTLSINQKGEPSPMANDKGKEPEVKYDASPGEDVAQYKNEIAQLKQQLESAQREKEVTAKFHELRRQGESLRDAGKLTPAGFSELFDNEAEAIAKYSQEPNEVSLSGIKFHLDMLEKHGAPVVEFGRATQEEPESKEIDSEEVNQAAKRIAARVLTYGGRK